MGFLSVSLRFTMGATPPRKKSKPASKYFEKWEADFLIYGMVNQVQEWIIVCILLTLQLRLQNKS